ncbi:chloride channel protein, CIC family [Methanolobus vulcani]|jgi:CIC family chloride channel protein|uniref:Chloride channel protein, CIC family n=1 Tax=Methanolobus vulcani TaxID=38026 RepID=A0A7Z7FCE2_9EURY|nr:chloride channel protein [Methanolobus vulcani]SDF67102.1 chloride channel protein, CIC family [Methanolobus vulcani]
MKSLDEKTAFQKFKQNIVQWLHTESLISNSLAMIIGILTGLVIVFYDTMLEMGHNVFFGTISSSPRYFIILLPAIGGLIVGLIVHYSINTRRYDIEEIIEATALRGGRMSVRNAFLEVLASIISIGSGGSAGKEAPVVLAGSGIGSALAETLNIHGNRVKILIGCGAASSIAAAYNAPLAGVVFVVEVILGELEASSFIPIVVSAVFATIVSSLVFGVDNIGVATYEFVDPSHEFALYLLLGILAGLISALLMRALFSTHQAFESLQIHPAIKPAVGGLFVGLIGFFYPQVFGVGYDVITDALNGNLTLQLMFLLIFLKIIAFSFTMGSGGSGGSIVPALFVGAMMGGSYGSIVHGIFPQVTAESGAYALVGMGAVFAGTSRAPLTSILILFELTRDYNMILPIMLACVVSNVISSSINSESIFTEGLRRRGFTIRKGREVDIMEALLVKDAMKHNVQTVSENKNVGALIALMQSSRHAGFPVLDSNGQLSGIVTLKDVRDKVGHDELEKTITEICSKDVAVAYQDETLNTVLKRLAAKDIGRLPVVSRSDSTKLLGIITRSDIVKLYDKKILDKVQRLQKNEP